MLTRRLTAPNVPMVASRAGAGTIRNPPPATRAMVATEEVTTTLPGTTEVDTVGTIAGTAMLPVVPPATARGVMEVVAMVCWVDFDGIEIAGVYLL